MLFTLLCDTTTTRMSALTNGLHKNLRRHKNLLDKRISSVIYHLLNGMRQQQKTGKDTNGWGGVSKTKAAAKLMCVCMYV